MVRRVHRVDLEEFDSLYGGGKGLPPYCREMKEHVEDGDSRLLKLEMDNSKASWVLWNFLLTEEERLAQARKQGKYIIGTMKDLGTIPVMAYSLPDTVAFYPDGAWWIPCIMELDAGLLAQADRLGIDESFCPVRAMLGAFINENHFPIPDLLISSSGAVCDDFSVIAQRLESLGFPIEWWEMPHIRKPEPGEKTVQVPGGKSVSESQVRFLIAEMTRLRDLMSEKSGTELTDDMLAAGIKKANSIRRVLKMLRKTVYSAKYAPIGALEMLIAEMLAIHFCSDRDETERVLNKLLERAERRVDAEVTVNDIDATKVFWVNPVADLRVMNLLEDCGCRLCGSDFMFTHALDPIPTDCSPLEALARTAAADPMTCDSGERAERICKDIMEFGSEALIISKIPGGSHCAYEARAIHETVKAKLGIPVAEIEVPPLADSMLMNIKTKIQTLKEIVRAQ